MSKRLHLSENFSLPREALLHVWSILAVRGAGKTYTASVLVEEILDQKMMPVIVMKATRPCGARMTGQVRRRSKQSRAAVLTPCSVCRRSWARHTEEQRARCLREINERVRVQRILEQVPLPW